MILDERAEFCDATEAIGTGASKLVGDVIDRQATSNTLIDFGAGQEVFFVLQVTTAYSGGTSAQFQLASDSTANLATSRTNHIDTGAITVGTLTAGYTKVYRLPVSKTYERYLGVWLTTVGAVAAGNINAFLTTDASAWAHYADASN